MTIIDLLKDTYFYGAVNKACPDRIKDFFREDPNVVMRRKFIEATYGNKAIVPRILGLELTNYCNASCTFCAQPNKMKRPQGFMSDELFEIVIRNIDKFKNINRVMLGGMGEPFLHKNIIEMIARLKATALSVIATTNGSRLNSVNYKELVESGIDKLSISMDAVDNDYLRQIKPGIKIPLEDIEETISNIYEYKMKIGSKTPYILLRYQITEDSNYMTDKTKEKNAIVKRKGAICDDVMLRQQHNWASQIDNIFNEKASKENHICSEFWKNRIVSWNGDVPFCCLDYDGKIVLGNVFETTSLRYSIQNQ